MPGDQYGTPTYVKQLVKGAIETVSIKEAGTYHIVGGTNLSRCEFGYKVAKEFGFNSGLIGCERTAYFKQAAKRPKFSGLISDYHLTDIDTALREFHSDSLIVTVPPNER